MQYGYDENDNNNIILRLSARPITASTSGTARATSTSPSTTPMTMLTSTIAWCTLCVERARRAHSFTLDVVAHLTAQDLSLVINISIVIHGRTSLTRLSLSTSTCFSLSFPSTSCTPSCPLSSTTRSSWKACATPPTRSDDANHVSTSQMMGTCAGGGICPRGSNQTAQRDTTVATTQVVKAPDDSAHGSVDETHFRSDSMKHMSVLSF